MEARNLSKVEQPAYQLSLRIRHPRIDPEEISRELRLPAEHAFKAGEPRTTSQAGRLSVHAESYWLGSLDAVLRPDARWLKIPSQFTADPTMALVGLTGALTLFTLQFARMHSEFLQRLRQENGEVCLIVEMSPTSMRGFTLTPQISRALGELGMAIEFEFSEE